MRVIVRTFAMLRELSIDRCELTLADGATMADAWDAMVASFPGLAPYRPHVRAARNGRYATWDEPLSNADVVALLPPVSGGASRGLTDGPIDVIALERQVAATGRGAVVTFTGRV